MIPKYISKKDSNNINKLKLIINNKKFIKRELINTKELFNNINGYSLDIHQRKAIINDENNILLLAPAGSGKTLTIIGKIRYLIEFKKIKEEDILCISFTNDSVNNLKKLLIKNYNYNIDVFTFHKLSLNIIKDNNENVNICNSKLLEYIVDEFFIRNISTNLLNTDSYKSLKILIVTFINQFKSNDYSIKFFDSILKNKKYCNEYILLWIIKQIYKEYSIELRGTNKIDFNDMINNATNIIKNNGYIKKYKYIIIDEYQDTSYAKYKLIKLIKEKVNAKLFVVGDDFQSIYRFTGCNLDIFLKFKKYFKYSKILKIINTYRNSKELIHVASTFILKNKKQIYKKLNSNKNLSKPIEIIYTNNRKKTLYELINKIDTNILLLGRNNNDINNYFNEVDSDGYINYTNKTLRYLTVHKSKGLEEENVIILNLEDKILGFPCKIQSNKILNYVLNEKDSYPYEEERRLFYVALTRTKNKVYLLVNRESESIFVKEIIKNCKKYINITHFNH